MALISALLLTEGKKDWSYISDTTECPEDIHEELETRRSGLQPPPPTDAKIGKVFHEDLPCDRSRRKPSTSNYEKLPPESAVPVR
jgi:hypothetical protein